MSTNAQEICARSRNKKTLVKVQLLDSNYNVVDELQGKATSGSITIKNSVDSNYSRRSGSLDMVLTKDLSTQYYKIDLIHKVRVIITVTDIITSISADYNMGIFVLSNPQILKSTTDQKITISLVDFLSQYDGTFGGSLDESMTTKVTSGTNISTAIQTTAINIMGISVDKMKIEATSLVTIEEISSSPESNVTDHLKSIMDDALNYDLYFNEDGILVFEYINDRTTDAIFQEFIESDVVVSYEVDEDFTNARNVVNIIGETIENSTIQQKGQYKETNLNNPLNIYSKYGEKPITITNDKLQTTEQCNNQAKYECQKRTNYKEKLSMEILQDFRLQPNKKIKVKYTSDNLIIDNDYLVDEISIDLKVGGLMTLTNHKIYYPST